MQEKNILELLYELKKKCIINDDAFMSDANLSQAEYHFFITVNINEEIKSNTIAKKMNLSLSRISRVINKLVKREYLTRNSDTIDRRTIKLALTEKGKKVKERIEKYRKDCELKIIKNLSTKELDHIKNSFNTILELL